jgi:hypothetical protein
MKLFRIDHPLEPSTKYLAHSCVESSEMTRPGLLGKEIASTSSTHTEHVRQETTTLYRVYSDPAKALVAIGIPASFAPAALGAVLSLKHYERFCFHRHLSRKLRQAIDAPLRYSEQTKADCGVCGEIRKSLGLLPESSSDLIYAIVKKANESYAKEAKSYERTKSHEGRLIYRLAAT